MIIITCTTFLPIALYCFIYDEFSTKLWGYMQFFCIYETYQTYDLQLPHWYMFFYRWIQSNLDTNEIYKFTSVGSQIPTSIRLSKQYIMIWFKLLALVGAASIFLAVGRFLESTKKITALLFCILMYVSNTNFLNILSKSFWLISIDCLKR